MDNESNVVKVAKSNWIRNGGCEINNVIQTYIIHEDIYTKPDVDEILCPNRTILLNRPITQEEKKPCEVQLHVFPPYKIDALTVLCNVSKIELFIGPQKEYKETIYGNILKEDEDETPNDGAFLSYRYDIDIEMSGIVEIVLKFITSLDEVCIFGFVLYAAPNPNGITTQSPSSINLENVKKMLENSKQNISPSAEKCKLFMQLCNQNSNLQNQLFSNTDPRHRNDDSILPIIENIIKKHIEEMEARLNIRLSSIDNRLNKMDEVLKIIQEKK